MRWRAVVVVAIAVFVGACSTGLGSSSGGPASTGSTASDGAASGGAPPGRPAGTTVGLTIFGAASLKGVLEAARTAYAAVAPDVSLTISTDSSATLEAQIEQGAPADVFLSADTANPQKLVDRGLAGGSAVAFARNQLTVIVPAANPAEIASPADLARDGLKIIAAGDAVPVAAYANQLVAALARQPGYPADFAERYAANIASKEDNVAAVLAKIELGEGDAAIVYATDARGSAKVATLAVPGDANVTATYAGVVVDASPNRDAAQAFLAWFAGPGGGAILAASGFLPPA